MTDEERVTVEKLKIVKPAVNVVDVEGEGMQVEAVSFLDAALMNLAMYGSHLY
jgi:hypothetical protein